MNIIFIGTTGIHHTLIAASMYLNQRIGQDFNKLKFWDDRDREALGVPLFLGTDVRSNKVYVLGVGWEVVMARKTLEQLDNILNKNQPELIVQPIFIKRERILFLLHRCGRFRLSRHLVRMLTTYLLNKEFFVIQNQVDTFRTRVGYV
jgi:Protein of unknown function (DUF3189).